MFSSADIRDFNTIPRRFMSVLNWLFVNEPKAIMHPEKDPLGGFKMLLLVFSDGVESSHLGKGLIFMTHTSHTSCYCTYRTRARLSQRAWEEAWEEVREEAREEARECAREEAQEEAWEEAREEAHLD